MERGKYDRSGGGGDHQESLLARAFNEGSDARLKGIPLREQQLTGLLQFDRYWRMGWHHVDLSWGSGARWSVKALPEVGYV